MDDTREARPGPSLFGRIMGVGRKAVRLAAVGCVLLIVVAVVLVYRMFHSWPSIEDPAALKRDAAVLMARCENEEGYRAPKNEWPATVRALKPIAVVAHEDHVFVAIMDLAISAGRGFLIYQDRAAVDRNDPTARVWSTVHPGIYKWQTRSH